MGQTDRAIGDAVRESRPNDNGWMMSKQKFLAVMFFLPMLVASAKADAVQVNARFAFSIDDLMAHFFQSHPAMILDSYIDSAGQTLPLPQGPISIDENFQTTTPLLPLGNVAPGASFSIRFVGDYFAINRTQGLPPVPIRARIRLDLRLLEPQPGTYRIQLVNILTRNEQAQEASHTRAIDPSLEGSLQGADTINLGGRLRIGLSLSGRYPLTPALFNQLL
jgi:hypothetical protein